MAKHDAEIERRVRIEMLRAKAAIERQQLCHATQAICDSLQPSQLVALVKGRATQQLKSSLDANSSVGAWLNLAGSMGQQYPLLSSGVSALAGALLGKSKWRFGALALSAWRLFGAYQALQQKKQDAYIQPSHPDSERVMGPLK